MKKLITLMFCSLALFATGTAQSNIFTIQTQHDKDLAEYQYSICADLPEFPRVFNSSDNPNILEEINKTHALIPNIESMTLKIEKEEHYLNGVSTLDLVIILRHILGIKPLTDKYDLIAADVNCSGKLSALDLYILRRLILSEDAELMNCPNWLFFNTDEDKDFVFTNDELPLDNLNIIAVKMGDVNNTVK